MKKFILILITLLFFIIGINTSFAQEKSIIPAKTKISSIKKQPKAVPVKLDEKTIFYIKSSAGIFSPEARAQEVSKRIEKIAKDINFDPDTISIIKDENLSVIAANQTHLIVITPNDAKLAGKTTDELSREIVKKIKAAIKNYRGAFSTKRLLLGLLYSIVTTALFLIIIGILNSLIRHIYIKIEKWAGQKAIDEIKFQQLNIFSYKRLSFFLKSILIIIQITIISIFLYIYTILILGFFPWTKTHSSYLYNNTQLIIIKILTPIGLYLPNLLIIVVICIFAFFGIRLSKFIFTEIKRETIKFNWFCKEWSDTTHNLVIFFIISFAIALLYPYLPGANSDAFKGVSIFIGILVSIGSSSAISNVVAGVILTYTNAFNIGDRALIGTCFGDIIEQNMFVIRIRTIKNELISIPNSKVLSSEIVNYTNLALSSGLIIHTEVTIGYDAPWRDVHEALIKAALATDNILKDKAPFVLQTALNDFYVTYELNAYIDTPYKTPILYSELHQNIQDKFNEAGIEIMSPHYTSLRDGNQTTIPQNYLGEEYKAPTFGLKINKRE